MSTRYVYGVYNTTAEKKTINSASLAATETYINIDVCLCNSYEASVAYNRQGTPVTYYNPTGSFGVDMFSPQHTTTNQTKYYAKDTLNYKYCILTQSTSISYDVILKSYLLELSSSSGAYWHIKTVDAEYGFASIDVWVNDDSSASAATSTSTTPIYQTGGNITQGSSLLYTETSNSGAKAQGAFLSGNSWRWRVYRGSDNIDPTAVLYSKNDLYPSEPVTITVTPGAPTYGGTIYYRYQYSINGGSTWTNIGSRTTATSSTVTIPEGAEQFQARVLASDGWGFTSSTYVYGPAKEVSQLKAYVGVNAKAGSMKKGYVGVGGKAMQLAKGYVGVGGVAKKLF